MHRLVLVVIFVVVCTGCKQVDSAYCPMHPGQEGCPDAVVSSGSCQNRDDCTGTPNTPVCNLRESPPVCVLCTEDDHALCTGTTPVCETKSSPPACVQCTENDHALCTGTTPLCQNDRCVACAQDSECGTGGLCLPNGACAASTSIIHAIATGGINLAGCGIPGGPGACTLGRALTEVTATKNVIKLDSPAPAIYSGTGLLVAKDVTIDARNAILQHNNIGTVLAINNNTTATIFGGTIDGQLTTDGDGIDCKPGATLTIEGTAIINMKQLAINAGGTSITMSRSAALANLGGGISVTSGTFVIVGNVFSNNGTTTSLLGGVLITTAADSKNRFEFNTIESNHAMSNAPGIQCDAGTGFVARNNIIWGNDNNNDNTGPQVGGPCKHAYSDIGMMRVGTTNDGGNNLTVDPMFKAPLFDLHLQPTSRVIMKADPAALLDGIAARDFDGDLRIAPADLGADQVPRP